MCRDRFHIPSDADNVTFIGVNRPLITIGPEEISGLIDVDDVEVDWDTLLSSLREVAHDRVMRAYSNIEENCEVYGMYDALWGPNDVLGRKLMEEAAIRTKRPDLMSLVGERYRDGDAEEAIEWFRESAAEDDPVGMFRYASCLINGYGVEQDIPAAVELIEKSANAGYIVAINQMGMEYNTGRRVRPNSKLAAKWYAKGAEQGHLSSIYNMALFYDTGTGVRRNRKEPRRCSGSFLI